MVSRLFSTGLISLLLVSFFPVQQSQAQQAPSAVVYQEAYSFLASANLIPGADTGDANGTITRAESLRVLFDAQDSTKTRVEYFRHHLSKLPLFTDVPSDQWLAPYAEAAFDAGVATGFSDRTLRPSDPVPAEEAIVMIMRAYRKPSQPSDTDHEWFAPIIRGALSLNVVADPHSMVVGQAITRGQFYDMMYRMSVVIRDNLASFPVAQTVAAIPVSDQTYAPASAVPAGGSVAEQIIDAPSQDSTPVIVARPTENPDERQFASPSSFAVTIPSLGIRDLQVTHPDDTLSRAGLLEPLQRGVGHLFSYPGKGGKIMIYGHSSGYSWDVSKYTKIFRQVNRLKNGDRVYVTFNGNLYAYSVTGQQTIAPNDAKPFTGQGEELILYTCWPPNSVKHRLIIRASPVETVAMR